MKLISILVFFLAIAAIEGCKKDTPILQADIIPNGDFENWDNGFLLQSWKTNSCPACVPAFETYVVQRDSNAYHGRFDAKFIFYNVYQAWASNKFKLDKHPLSLSAYAKCNLHEGDTVFIKIRLLRNSIVTDSGQWIGTSSIPGYSKITIPITQNALLADSALISIKGGYKTGPTTQITEFWLDYMTLR